MVKFQIVWLGCRLDLMSSCAMLWGQPQNNLGFDKNFPNYASIVLLLKNATAGNNYMKSKVIPQ